MKFTKEESLKYFQERNNIFNNLRDLNLLNSRSNRLNSLLEGYCMIIGFAVIKKDLFDPANELKRQIKKSKEKGKGRKQRILLKIQKNNLNMKI